MNPKKPNRKRIPLATCLAAGLVATSSNALAQTNGTWDGGGNTSIWGGINNWNPNGQIATGVGATATFATAFANGRTILLNGSRSLGNVVYTDPGAETEMI